MHCRLIFYAYTYIKQDLSLYSKSEHINLSIVLNQIWYRISQIEIIVLFFLLTHFLFFLSDRINIFKKSTNYFSIQFKYHMKWMRNLSLSLDLDLYMNCLMGQRKDVLGSAKEYDHTITKTVKWVVRQVFNEKYSDCLLYYFGLI